MPAEVLLTGSSGFVGGHLYRALAAGGLRVHTFSAEDGDIARNRLPFENIAHVFHLAAKTYVPESWRKPAPFYEVNVLGAVNVLEFCRSQDASLTLVSSYVYGRPQCLPIAEDHPLEAFNPYAQTKILAEEIAQFYQKAYGVRVSILRPFNLYGPGQDRRFLIPTLIAQYLDPDCEVVKVADVRPRRDYLYIDDFIALLLAAFDRRACGVYNAGSGASASVEEIAALVAQAAGSCKPLVSEGCERPQEVMDIQADVSKAGRDFGWRPHTPLPEGIANTVRHFQWISPT